jgi:hypothetical protein
MNKEAIEYSRLVRMFCTPPSYSLSEGEINALKKADKFTVRFEDWDLPCYWATPEFKFQITSTQAKACVSDSDSGCKEKM